MENQTAERSTALLAKIAPLEWGDEWLAMWDRASYEEKLGLLHSGMDCAISKPRGGERQYTDNDRIEFYLKVADNYRHTAPFKLPEDGSRRFEYGHDESGHVKYVTPARLRQNVARKALDVLATHFFKPVTEKESEDLLLFFYELILQEKLFQKIQHFFRTEPDYMKGGFVIRNLNTSSEQNPSEQRASNFLVLLAEYILDWQHVSDTTGLTSTTKEHVEKFGRSVDKSLPWVTKILSKLNRLDVLEKRWLRLPKGVLDELELIALQTMLFPWNHPVKEERRVLDLAEAVYAGSNEALFLLTLKLRTREHERLWQVLETERALENARTKSHALSSPR